MIIRSNLLSKQIARRDTRVSKIRSSNRSSSRETNDEVFSLRTMNVSHFHYAHRESARMIVNLREWRSSLFEDDECISLSLDVQFKFFEKITKQQNESSWVKQQNESSRNDSIVDLLIRRVNSSVNCRSSCSSSLSINQ